jgi:hypothetical protein
MVEPATKERVAEGDGAAERVTGGEGAQPVPVAGDDESTLRALAIKQAERVRGFKAHAAAYVLGVLVLGVIWVLTEYFEEHTWPDRFADAPDVAGTWSPWYFWAVGIWALVLAIHAFRTFALGPFARGPFAHRPPTEAEIQRELGRLRRRS